MCPNFQARMNKERGKKTTREDKKLKCED
uniref:Uncharacterized protein n=1 Tax=Rhizophora mucronata TaxID=61149 RepID=A0A2P2IK27_RHIMU